MTITTLANDAAAVGLLRLLVKHFGLSRKIVRAFHQIVQLYSTFQDTVNRFVQNLCGFIQIVLDFRNFVRCRRILVLLEVFVQCRKGNRFRSRASLPSVSNGCCKVIQKLRQQDERNTGGVLGIGNNGSSESIRSNVAVDNVILVSNGLALAWLCSLHECPSKKSQHFLNRRSLEESKRGELRAHGADNRVRNFIACSNGG
mmetsp:Transcript_14626/g.30244  ORF Transcript_14626/g.30244 Transcript_14626/m.30244 type:complete len:201 (+) Transcript_14626:160-762(+)